MNTIPSNLTAHKSRSAVLAALIASSGFLSAQELIKNGNFEDVLHPGYAAQLYIHPVFDFDSIVATATGPDGSMPLGVQEVFHWNTTGYNFLMTPGSATSGGAGSVWNDHITFWERGGSVIPATSPDGGNFIALDAAYRFGRNWDPYNEASDEYNLVQPFEQTVDGLEIGQEYALSFYWAAAHQYDLGLPTNDDILHMGLFVTFGDDINWTSETFEILSESDPSFKGWQQVTLNFTATATSEILSFLAGGGPDGLPPFVFLDGVSMQAIPEPGSLALFGLASAAFFLRRRRK